MVKTLGSPKGSLERQREVDGALPTSLYRTGRGQTAETHHGDQSSARRKREAAQGQSTKDRVMALMRFGLKSFAALWALHPFKIYPLDLIRRDGEAALGARRVQRGQHFFQVEFS